MNVTRRDMAAVVGAAVAAGLVLRSGAAGADCPNIVRAIDSLTKAQGDLQNAAHDYDGHRQEALDAVNHALDKLGKCLQSHQCK
jgi:hypothetical protein